MNTFNMIKDDEKIIKHYNEISIFEDFDEGCAHHDFKHVFNVSKLVEKLLKDLNYYSEFIEEAKIAAILHDTGCLQGKDGHALRSYEYAKDYLEEKNIHLKNYDLVLEAIKIHSDGFDTNNIIALTLILSDKLDIKHTRVAKAGYNMIGMRQFLYIQDILVEIKNNILKVNFICDNAINKKELEEYYFIPKVFKAIKAFSNKLELDSIVLFNNKKWEAFENI